MFEVGALEEVGGRLGNGGLRLEMRIIRILEGMLLLRMTRCPDEGVRGLNRLPGT